MTIPCRSLLLAAVFATVAIQSAAAESPQPPVIDDERLARDFVGKLGGLIKIGTTLDAELSRQQLADVAGRRVAAPTPAVACRIGPGQSLYDAVVPGVVAVGSVFKCEKCNDWHLGQLASGWLLSADGLVVTNHHVLQRDKGNKYGVMTSDGEVYAVTEVVAAAPAGDAAVIRIDTRGRRLPFLALGPQPACGDPVTVISHPKGRFYCLSNGVVSRYHRQRRWDQAANADGGKQPGAGQHEPSVWMSVTADYATGSSGGPVFNTVGEVVGMVSRTVAALPDAGGEPGQPAGPKPNEQMTFKDCVSPETLQSLIKVGR